MLMPSIFGENLFDDLFDDFARPMNVIHYATPTPSAMKTDVKETEQTNRALSHGKYRDDAVADT